MALILADLGEYEEASAAACEMLNRAVGMESGRIRDRIGTVVAALKRQPRTAATFLERAAAALAVGD